MRLKVVGGAQRGVGTPCEMRTLEGSTSQQSFSPSSSARSVSFSAMRSTLDVRWSVACLVTLVLCLVASGCYGPEMMAFGPTYAPLHSDMVYVKVSVRRRHVLWDYNDVDPRGYIAFDLRKETAQVLDYVEPRTLGVLDPQFVYEEFKAGELVFELLGADGQPLERFCEGWGLPPGECYYDFAAGSGGGSAFVFVLRPREGRSLFGSARVSGTDGKVHDLRLGEDWLIWSFSAASDRYAYLVLRKQMEAGPGWFLRTDRLDQETGEQITVAEGSFEALDAKGSLIERYEDRGMGTWTYPDDSRCRLIESGSTRTISLALPGVLPLESLEAVSGTGWVLAWYQGLSLPRLYQPLSGRWIECPDQALK